MSSILELHVVAGPQSGAVYKFDDQLSVFVVGSDAVAHLSVQDDTGVSRFHCRFEIAAPHCSLVDLASRSGTFVNGSRVAQCAVGHGDRIQVGSTEIRVQLSRGNEGTTTLEQLEHCDLYAPTIISSDKPRIPGYEIVEEIGAGGLGCVYRAVSQSAQTEVAIKVVRPDRTASHESLQIFVREISVLSQLNHPRIVRYHECGRVDDRMFFVMDLVPTVDFFSAMADQSTSARLRIPCGLMCYVLDALQYAHERHLVHRDVKPENILISQSGHRLKAKLADFGLAKNFEVAGLSGITPSGTIRGTISYMAPEQLLNAREARPPCDVYSAGASLYFYLTGEPPFDSPSVSELLRSVMEKSPPPVQERAPAVPNGLAEVVDRALEKDPNRRFRTAEEFQSALLPFTKRSAYV